MTWMLLPLVAWAATADTADTIGGDTAAAVESGRDTSQVVDTASGEAATVDTGLASAASLRAEAGGLGCSIGGRSGAGGPGHLAALGVLTWMLRRRDDDE